MPTPLEELSSISQILSAAAHRNKNQHRLAKWWKPFSVLRRNLYKLISELETLSANEERLGETKKTTASREVVERRAEFMVEWVVPKCYLAFSAVVADNQFASLGLMLVGTLARAQKVIKPLRKEIERDKDAEPDLNDALMGQEGLDFGEVIKREETEKNRVGMAEEDGEANFVLKNLKKHKGMDEPKDEIREESTPAKPRKKRKKKGGDELDALFGTLL